MRAAFLFLAPLVDGGRRERAARGLLVAGFALAVVSFAGVSLAGHGTVAFEVVAIAIDWTVLVVAGILLAAHFRARPGAPVA